MCWTGNKNYSEKIRLPNVFQSELKPIFGRQTNDILSMFERRNTKSK